MGGAPSGLSLVQQHCAEQQSLRAGIQDTQQRAAALLAQATNGTQGALGRAATPALTGQVDKEAVHLLRPLLAAALAVAVVPRQRWLLNVDCSAVGR